jgi:hypothetical protein
MLKMELARIAQAVQLLSRKCEVPTSHPGTSKRKKKAKMFTTA